MGVLGFSDKCRTFHTLALWLTSQRTSLVISEALQGLNEVASVVTPTLPSPLPFSHCMTDADVAGKTAFESVFSHEQDGDAPAFVITVLMCFFHVLYNVNKRVHSWNFALQEVIYLGIYSMHFCRSLDGFLEMREKYKTSWSQHANQRVKDFAEYFFPQWCNYDSGALFWMWQIYHSPIGFATTNNPVEIFNKDFKILTEHKLHTTVSLLMVMINALKTIGSVKTYESSICIPKKDAINRSNQMVKTGRLLCSSGEYPHLVKVS